MGMDNRDECGPNRIEKSSPFFSKCDVSRSLMVMNCIGDWYRDLSISFVRSVSRRLSETGTLRAVVTPTSTGEEPSTYHKSCDRQD